MKKILSVFAAIYFLAIGVVQADEYVYRLGNNPATFVKLEKYKGPDTLNQPYNFDQDKLADILRSLRYSRKALFSDKVKTRFVFEEEYIVKHTPHIIEAFKKADNKQAVVFSVAQKRPYVIVRNDKLTQIRMWVVGQELHLYFIKTEAQLLGDYQARNPGSERLIDDAKSLRVELEPQQGQKFAASSMDELIVDLNADWKGIVTRLDEEEERLKAEQDTRKKRREDSKTTITPRESSTSTSAQPVATPTYTSTKDKKDAETRLQELKKLKDKGLISEQDYNKKKDEILSGM